eukprot:scaffold116972_cov30-Tisochrysis_lutea.AAC.1
MTVCDQGALRLALPFSIPGHFVFVPCCVRSMVHGSYAPSRAFRNLLGNSSRVDHLSWKWTGQASSVESDHLEYRSIGHPERESIAN